MADRCPHCSHELVDTAKKCPACGASTGNAIAKVEGLKTRTELGAIGVVGESNLSSGRRIQMRSPLGTVG
jgi:hypothetical protein